MNKLSFKIYQYYIATNWEVWKIEFVIYKIEYRIRAICGTISFTEEQINKHTSKINKRLRLYQ